MAKRTAKKPLDSWLDSVGPHAAFDALSALLPDATVMVVDADRDVVLWSEGAERMLGFEAADVLGSHCLKAHRCANCMGSCGIERHGTLSDIPLTLHHSDGSPVRVRKTAKAFFDGKGNFAGGIEVLLPDTSLPAEPPPPSQREGVTEFHGLISRDPSMLRIFQTVRNVAETEATVLVRGESGSGKELVARAIHDESLRRKGPFVAVNCAALTPSLVESELFGHVRGAFTGAVRDRQGLFAEAHGGSLFLDEVAELSLEVQAKLLRVLEDKVVVPVGGGKGTPVNVRVISATHRGLRREVKEERFREDLMFRLRIVPLFLPALRERRNDIELLLWHFIDRFNERGPRRVKSVSPDAMRLLMDHAWPGNVREMRNIVEYAFAVGRDAELALDDLPVEFRETTPEPPLDTSAPGSSVDEAERIRQALDRSGGHLGKTAQLLGVSRATLWRKRKQHGL